MKYISLLNHDSWNRHAGLALSFIGDTPQIAEAKAIEHMVKATADLWVNSEFERKEDWVRDCLESKWSLTTGRLVNEPTQKSKPKPKQYEATLETAIELLFLLALGTVCVGFLLW